MHVAVIPARSGSKGVPHKNMLRLWGHSLIAWAARCAEKAGMFSQIILSTDSEQYAAEGVRYGCTVPYLRPNILARDEAPIVQTLLELLTKVEGADRWRTLCLIEPTCPLRTPEMVAACFRLVADTPEVDSSLTLTPVPVRYHYLKQFSMNERGDVTHGHPDAMAIANRQQLKPSFIRNGAAYVMRCSSLRETGRILNGRVSALMIAEQLVNIDSTEDIEQLRRIESEVLVPPWWAS
jgi:CMP-N,N'-diacetyllegionaminic acid synthase